jgi:hypothetical protein
MCSGSILSARYKGCSRGNNEGSEKWSGGCRDRSMAASCSFPTLWKTSRSPSAHRPYQCKSLIVPAAPYINNCGGTVHVQAVVLLFPETSFQKKTCYRSLRLIGSSLGYLTTLWQIYDRLCGLVVRVPGYATEMYWVSCEVRTEFIYVIEKKIDRLCGLVVRVPGCRSRGPGSISGATRFSLRSSGSGTRSTQPREYNWGATWKKK